jgi:transcriptional regulator with AAA-type ATPase domain
MKKQNRRLRVCPNCLTTYTIKIFIPPLKERKDDIPLLIDYILKRESCENKLKSISQGDLTPSHRSRN